jgi:hypothetical protein
MYSPYYNEEVWVDIIDFPGYQVSNTGKVRNIKDFRLLGQQLNKAGYYTVNLRKDLESYTCLVHRLVAIAFLPNPDNLPIVNHKDENTINPNVENLEWCTAEYNVNYGTSRERAKETKVKNKLLEQAKQAAKIIEDKKDKTKKVYTKGIDYSDFVFSRKFDNSKPIIVKKTNTVRVKKFHKKHNRQSNKNNSFCNDKLVLKINRHTVGSVSYDITLKTFRNKIAKNN